MEFAGAACGCFAKVVKVWRKDRQGLTPMPEAPDAEAGLTEE
jgi:hypothetical protein